MTLNIKDLAFNRPVSLFDFTRELMDGFIIQTEESIKSNIETFKVEGANEYEIEISAEDGIYQYVETYMGLDCFTVDLDEIFTSYFPNLQRRSAFLTLVATYEHEFEKFCLVYANNYNKVQVLTKLKQSGKKGFELYHEFIKKGIGIKGCTKYGPIKAIVKLRNSCAHNDARFVDNSGRDIKKILELLRDYPDSFESHGKQIELLKGSLEYTHQCFKEYIHEIGERIKEKE